MKMQAMQSTGTRRRPANSLLQAMIPCASYLTFETRERPSRSSRIVQDRLHALTSRQMARCSLLAHIMEREFVNEN